MLKKIVSASALLIVLSSVTALAQSDLSVNGLKYPNSPDEGLAPVSDVALAPADKDDLKGFTELVPYVLRSPDQEEAGSCLYMSLTGVAEFWLARMNPGVSRDPEGPIDLSERYMMNLVGIEESENGTLNWKTDSMELFNRNQHRSVLNTSYRFTKGWYRSDARGNHMAAREGQSGASYDATYNWINELARVRGGFVDLPEFEREVLFADPESNQWNVGVMPKDIVETVKTRLLVRKAPVHVIYNHFGYWHSVFIVGFDDDKATEGCNYITRFRDYMKAEPIKIRSQAAQARTEAERQALLKRAIKFEQTSAKLEGALTTGQYSCAPKGMFYVRDSIYGAPSEPIYKYDLSNPKADAPYSKPIIYREYEWLKYIANHASQIYVAE